jgi:TonB-dependent receptor-like protein
MLCPLQIQRAPNFGVQNYTNLGPSIWTGTVNANDVNDFIGNLTKVRGRHTFKMGADLRFQRLNYAQPPVNTAAFGFCNQETMSNALSPVTDQGNGLASFILGWGNSGCALNGGGQSFNLVPLVASRSYSFYGQDDFRVTPHLTLNMGLRYELPIPATERHNRFNWIDLNAASPIQSGVTAFMAANHIPDPANPSAAWPTVCLACSHLTGGYIYADANHRHAFDTDYTDWAPRFGFAYQFHPHMVVRGGYGFFYGLSSAQNTGELADGFIVGTPWIPSVDHVHQTSTIVNPLPNGLVEPTGPKLGLIQTIGGDIYGPMRSIAPTPRIQEWSLSVERELPGNSMVEIAYSGSKGNRLGYGTDRIWANYFPTQDLSLGDHLFDPVANPFYGLVPATSVEGSSGPTIPRFYLLQPHPQFELIEGRPGPPWGNSIYHSGYVRFSKRMSQGLQLDASYTYSKLITDSDSADDPNLDWLYGAIGGASYLHGRARTQDCGNLTVSDRSVSILDVPHRFVADFIYQLPIGRGRALGRNWNRVLDIVAGGWQVNGFMTFASGVPILPHLANRSFMEIGIQQRPNMVPGQPVVTSRPIESKLNDYLNPAAFSQPTAYTFGTAPRALSYVRAPGFHGADMSVFKQFYISREKQRYFELRVEAFNVTNTPIFGVPGTFVGGSDPEGIPFGVISNQANSPRQVQLGAKLYF